MAITQVITGAAIKATDLAQATNVLDRPAGQQEIGKYFLAGNSYINGGAISQSMNANSKSNFVSASIDFVDQAPGTVFSANPIVYYFGSTGFLIRGISNGAQANMNTGGNYTLQY